MKKYTKTIQDAIASLSPELKQVVDMEGHLHELEIKDGRLRWKQKIDYTLIDLNKTIELFYLLNWDKNSPEYRHLYRSIGYSIYGYWEVFYWNINNPKCRKYKAAKFPN